MSHFPRDGIEDIANTEPGYEVRIANNVVHVATNDVPANQKFLHLKIPHFSSNGVAAVVKAGVWMRWMLLRSLSASPPNQSPLPASSGTLFATCFRCRPAAERTVSRRCNVPEHIFIGEAEFPKDADDIRELFEEYAAWLARHDVPWVLQRTAEWHDWIQELATLPGKYAPPSGRLLLARCDHAAAGCVGLRPIEPGILRNEAVVCAARVSRPELGIETRGASNREGKAIGYSSMHLDTVPKAML
jgi:hypothetical protein